jgi:hypothetical protein
MYKVFSKNGSMTQRKSKSSQKQKQMNLTKDISEIMRARIQKDPELAILLLDEALSVFIDGEPYTAQLVLHNLVSDIPYVGPLTPNSGGT